MIGLRRWFRFAVVTATALAAAAAFGQSKKEVSLWVGRNVAPGPKIRLNINTRNVRVVRATVYPIDGTAWLKDPDRNLEDPSFKMPKPTGPRLRSWDVTVATPKQVPRYGQADAYYSRQTNLPKLQPGVYLVTVEGGSKKAWGVVNVTHLAIVVKRSPKRMLVWVTDAIKGGLVKGAKVVAYNDKGAKVTSGVTGSDGVCLIPIKPGPGSVVVNRGLDYAGVDAGVEDPDGKLRPHFQSDRSLYRPGQRIQYRVLLRRTLGQGYKTLSGQSVDVEFQDPRGNVLDKETLKANAMGTVAGSFEIPSEGMIGPYSVVLHVGDDETRVGIPVEEYRKPEYKVTVGPAAKRYLAGEEATFKFDAQYFFGAPVPQGEIAYNVTRMNLGFYGDEGGWNEFDDGNLYPSDTYRGNPVAASGTVHTDKDGQVIVKFTTDKDAPDSTYVISAAVQDSSRRVVQAGGSVPVYAAALRVGLRTDVVCAPLSSLIPVQVRTVDLDGRPVSATADLSLYRYEWVEKEGRYKQVKIAGLTAKTSPTGKATVNLPAKAVGSLLVKAVVPDGTGRKAHALLTLYVVGPAEKTVRERVEPEVSVRLDRRSYKPGDAVQAYVVTNYKKTPMLAVLEGGDVWDYIVVPAGKTSRQWTIKTNAAMSPNAYVDVTQWCNLDPLSGDKEIPLPDPARAIHVSAKPDKEGYRPGDKSTWTVTASDAKGKPVPAEVSMAVVDEALFALRPDQTIDLWGLYWGPRGNQVSTTTSAPEEISGGAYQDNRQAEMPAAMGGAAGKPAIPLRVRFEDTAYWNAFVETGEDGTAEVSFDIPGNLTTWRATSRGVTFATSVGTGVTTVKANRDVMLRLATPRQMVQGDELRLIGTIDNRSDQEQTFKVALTAKDIQVQGVAEQEVKVGAKGQAKVEWTIVADKVPATGSATLKGEVWVPNLSADFADALQVPLKIAPRGVEERFVASGTLIDRGEATLELPEDRIAGVGTVDVTVWTGLRAAMEAAVEEVLGGGRYGSTSAAAHLEVATVKGLKPTDKEVRETLAMLAKLQTAEGWGWWEDSPADPVITARVMVAVGHARAAGIGGYDAMMKRGQANLVDLFRRTNLWEYRALLAGAAGIVGETKAPEMLAEVVERGEAMSPFARLQVAEGLAAIGKEQAAAQVLESVLKDASDGPVAAFLPTGDGIGWSASEVETTAQGLETMVKLGARPDLQTKIARWLVTPSRHWWLCGDENATKARALALYLKEHPEAAALGPVDVEVAGRKVSATPAKVGSSATARIPMDWLTGKDVFKVSRTEPGEAMFKVDARVFRPGLYENAKGVRVLRRFEVRNDAGVWVELNRAVRTSEPVRCTVVVWGDDLNDALRVVEPIPSGFEFVENELGGYGRSEVRDAAVVHYLGNGGAPQTFRFYIRAESEGRLIALPATAEYIRRPATRGQSAPLPMEVKAKK